MSSEDLNGFVEEVCNNKEDSEESQVHHCCPRCKMGTIVFEEKDLVMYLRCTHCGEWQRPKESVQTILKDGELL